MFNGGEFTVSYVFRVLLMTVWADTYTPVLEDCWMFPYVKCKYFIFSKYTPSRFEV